MVINSDNTDSESSDLIIDSKDCNQISQKAKKQKFQKISRAKAKAWLNFPLNQHLDLGNQENKTE